MCEPAPHPAPRTPPTFLDPLDKAARKNTQRVELAGSEFKEEEQDRLNSAVEHMAKMGRATVGARAAAKAKARAAYKEPVRVPTFNYSADIENQLMAGIGHSWSPWLPAPLAWDADLPDGSTDVTPMAVVNVDQCSLNVSFGNFAKNHLGAAFWMRFGKFHRRSNDMMRATCLSRLIGSAQRAIVWLSCTHGAWVQASYLRAFQETAADIPRIYRSPGS